MGKRKQQRKTPIANNCVEDGSSVRTIIQGGEATFVQTKSHTSLFFGGFEDIVEEEFLTSYGSKDPNFVHGLLVQLANVSPRIRQVSVNGYDKAPDVQALKSLAASLRALAPRDTLEATIGAQMVVTHALSMMFTDQVSRSSSYEDEESAELSATRLLRTYSALSEALERHRSLAQWNVGDVKAIAEPPNGTALPSLRFEGKGLDGKVVGTIGSGHGLNDPDFVSSLFGPLTRIGHRSGLVVDPGLWFARAFVRGVVPQDGFEAQICAQMAVAHSYVMFFSNRLTQAEDWSGVASAERSLTRFSRTFCAQIEVFERHRLRCSRKQAARQQSIAGSAPRVGDIHHQNGATPTGIVNGATATGKVNGHAPA